MWCHRWSILKGNKVLVLGVYNYLPFDVVIVDMEMRIMVVVVGYVFDYERFYHRALTAEGNPGM